MSTIYGRTLFLPNVPSRLRRGGRGLLAHLVRAPALQAGGARFESAVVHAFGIEEDGNLPDSDSGETRFDSGGPDRDVV